MGHPVRAAIVAAGTWLLRQARAPALLSRHRRKSEAARRAGISVSRLRTIAFTFAGFNRRSRRARLQCPGWFISSATTVATYVLYAVQQPSSAARASPDGGRGKAIHVLLGGIVIAAIYTDSPSSASARPAPRSPRHWSAARCGERRLPGPQPGE